MQARTDAVLDAPLQLGIRVAQAGRSVAAWTSWVEALHPRVRMAVLASLGPTLTSRSQPTSVSRPRWRSLRMCWRRCGTTAWSKPRASHAAAVLLYDARDFRRFAVLPVEAAPVLDAVEDGQTRGQIEASGGRSLLQQL